MAGTTGIRTYLEPDLARQVMRVAKAQGRSESAFIADAVRATLAKGSDGAVRTAEDSQTRRLNRIEDRIDKILRDQAVLKEAVFAFVRIWLEHNPPIEPELSGSLAASATARFARFVDLAVTTYAEGGIEAILAEDDDADEDDDEAEEQAP